MVSGQYEQSPKATAPQERDSSVLRPAQFLGTIAATYRQIDALVYKFYGSTGDEVRVVEGAAK